MCNLPSPESHKAVEKEIEYLCMCVFWTLWATFETIQTQCGYRIVALLNVFDGWGSPSTRGRDMLPTRVALIYLSIYSVRLSVQSDLHGSWARHDVTEENIETPQNFYGQEVTVLTSTPPFHPKLLTYLKFVFCTEAIMYKRNVTCRQDRN